MWQKSADNWIASLIQNIEPWLARKYREIDFDLTQMLPEKAPLLFICSSTVCAAHDASIPFPSALAGGVFEGDAQSTECSGYYATEQGNLGLDRSLHEASLEGRARKSRSERHVA